MAAANPSPSGFSYAQAAARRANPASQTSSSKATSGAAAPANPISLEASSAGNWADDVEDSVVVKDVAPEEVKREESKSSLPKESAVDRTKAEDRILNGVSGVSSPDNAGSSTTSAATRDDSPSAPTGSSSDITSDTKSQSSEPAWIAERKERQSIPPPVNENTPKSERRSKKNAGTPKEEPKPPAPPVVLQDAPLPSFNPWQKRAEDLKTKVAVTPKPAPAPVAKSTPAAPSVPKENPQPSSNPPRKPDVTTTAQRESSNNVAEAAHKQGGTQGKRANEVRINGRQNSRPSTGESRSDAPPNSWSKPMDTRNSATSARRLPFVQDETSWPTPDTAQEKERKENSEKEAEATRDDENTPIAKRKKQEWKELRVEPNIIWETTSMNEQRERKPRIAAGTERGGRGGTRGRGAHRGGASSVQDGDRNSRSSPPPSVKGGEQANRGQPTSGEDGITPSSGRHPRNANGRESQGQKSASDRVGDVVGRSDMTDGKRHPKNVDGGFNGVSDARRGGSPRKSAPTQAGETDDVPTPAPIPRQVSSGTQTEAADGKLRADPPVRMVATEGRKDSRNYDNTRESTWNSAPRGGKRGGRGRGGNSRELTNGHAFANSFQGDFNASSPYAGVPPSPSGYRGNHHQFGHPPPGPARGGWSRGGPRSHSIPLDGMYQRFMPGQYGTGPVPSLHHYPAGMFGEYWTGNPVPAAMPSAQEAQDTLTRMVMDQVQYYFSIENLCHDMFLRKNMDSQGFVFLEIVANFNRLRQLTTDKDLLKVACLKSEEIDVRVGEDGRERLRKHEGWENFIFPMEERVESAKTEGPQHLERPERPQLSMPNGSAQFQGPHSAGFPPQHQQFDSHRSMPMMNGFAPQFVPNGGYHETMHGHAQEEEMRGRVTKSPVYENGVGSTDRPFNSAVDDQHDQPDAFPNDQISALGIVVRASGQQTSQPSAPARTFSNGSIDSRSIAAEMNKTPESDGQKLMNGDSPAGEKKRSLSRHLSPNKARSPEPSTSKQEREVCWAKDMNDIPEGTTYEPYDQLRTKALDQRNHASTGNCPYDLDVLYQFWCHFLCRNFNNRMYSEFKHYAQEDARERRSVTGINNLLKFYAHSLASFEPIRDRIAKDYADLVQNEPPMLEGAAFKQLRQAWRNGALNIKNRKRLTEIADPTLKDALDKTEV